MERRSNAMEGHGIVSMGAHVTVLRSRANMNTTHVRMETYLSVMEARKTAQITHRSTALRSLDSMKFTLVMVRIPSDAMEAQRTATMTAQFTVPTRASGRYTHAPMVMPSSVKVVPRAVGIILLNIAKTWGGSRSIDAQGVALNTTAREEPQDAETTTPRSVVNNLGLQVVALMGHMQYALMARTWG
jgi:hypothetical protein